jgi:hypothetical protein
VEAQQATPVVSLQPFNAVGDANPECGNRTMARSFSLALDNAFMISPDLDHLETTVDKKYV